MKTNGLIILLITAILVLNFSIVHGDGWVQKANMGTGGRWIATGFSIKDKGYIGTGSISGSLSNDFWEFDPAINTWTQMADFPGTARWGAIGFGIGSFGYIGLGVGGGFNQDFWEYAQGLNTWTQKANFPGAAREFCASFSIGTKGYVGVGWGNGGISGHFQDFWEWDQSTDTWTQKSDFGGSARRDVIGFSIGDKGYIGTGYDGNLKSDFWEWDQSTDTWTQRADIPVGRNVASSFSICDKGFVGTGSAVQGGGSVNDLWQWDQSTNVWTQKANFGGTPREHAVGFAINGKGYLGTGAYYGTGFFNYYNDLWEYTPDSVCEPVALQESNVQLHFALSPNPVINELTISGFDKKEETRIVIVNNQGKLIYEKIISGEENSSVCQVNTSRFASGIYWATFKTGNVMKSVKFVKV
ncbi:MAG: T9SS type A sorting domain-containing protein [Bacteroidota bacterium]|nr:T9SS type A sorting domain-containing protein [Bacteroidota bacterium]